MVDGNILNFDLDPHYEYDVPVLLQGIVKLLRKMAENAPAGTTISQDTESVIDFIMSGPLGEVIGHIPREPE